MSIWTVGGRMKNIATIRIDEPNRQYGIFMKKIRAQFVCGAVVIFLITAFLALPAPVETESLSAEEFSRMIHELSEEGGTFISDNFTSSEDSYLTIVDKLQEFGVTGGAYIGVGPEQNFTYIARIRPRIAFIVDIRRQAMIQHLMYKAIFHLSPTRSHFLSYLLSRPIPEGKAPDADAPLDEILAFFDNISADNKTYADNLAVVVKTIQVDFKFPLSPEDQASLDYVYRSFRTYGFDIGFDVSPRRGRGFNSFPNLRSLLAMRDLEGKQGSFLAARGDYDYVRGMQDRNLVIPVVGDFSGKRALAAVGDYLRKRKLTVSVFYVSNVEIVLFDWGSFEKFADFVENVKKLPTDQHSLLLRSTFSYYGPPAQLRGYQLCNMLQKVSVFLQDFSEGRYKSYRDLLMIHNIAAGKP
jgi:hypothetical protein